jgi:hypothetical protein
VLDVASCKKVPTGKNPPHCKVGFDSDPPLTIVESGEPERRTVTVWPLRELKF